MSLSSTYCSRKWLACGLPALLLLSLAAAHGAGVSAYVLHHDPLVSTSEAAPPAAPIAHLSSGTAVRSGPGDHYLILSITETSEGYPVLGRTRDGQWWRIDYRGLPAWVAAAQVETEAADAPVVQVGGEHL